jgi:hypothetical protein
MRFCPFCSAENADELAVCQACGRRLPPLPPRRARNAPPTGVQLPPRSGGTTQPPPLRRTGATIPPVGAPPAAPSAQSTQLGPALAAPGPASSPFAPPGQPVSPGPSPSPSPFAPPSGAPHPVAVMVTSPGFAPLAPSSTGMRAPASSRDLAPGGPAPGGPAARLASDEARMLASALSPGPAAQRREAPPAEPGDPAGNARRRSDGPPLAVTTTAAGISPSGPRAIPSVVPGGATSGQGAAPSGPRSARSTSPPPLTGAASPLTGAPLPPTGAASPPTGAASPPTGAPLPPTGAPLPPTAIDPALAPTGAAFPPAGAPIGAPPASPAPRSGAPSLLSGAPSTGAAPPTGAAAPPTGAQPTPAAARPGLAGPHVAPDPPWATGYPRAPGGFIDPDLHASALSVDASRRRADGVEPPPTRIHRPEALVDRPFTPLTVSPVPAIPEPGLINSARYSVRFARARWQRRGAIRLLGADIKKDTDALDQVLGALGAAARTAKVDGRVFSGENAAITAAEEHAAQMAREHNDVDTRKLEENARFVDVERERNTKLAEAERMVDEAQKELAHLEAQRRGLRDLRKELERRQKAYLKAAEDNEKQATATELGDQRQDLRRGAEQHRREAAAIEPERQEADRGLAAIERPIAEVSAKLDAAKAELDAAKGSLADAREGHTHRLAELDAEQKRKAREIAQSEAEIARRLVTLGTLVNLNRIEDPQFAELYHRIDRLRGAITARATEIEKLTAEREAYDRGHLVRGVATIGGAILLFIALIVILRAVLVG